MRQVSPEQREGGGEREARHIKYEWLSTDFIVYAPLRLEKIASELSIGSFHQGGVLSCVFTAIPIITKKNSRFVAFVHLALCHVLRKKMPIFVFASDDINFS